MHPLASGGLRGLGIIVLGLLGGWLLNQVEPGFGIVVVLCAVGLAAVVSIAAIAETFFGETRASCPACRKPLTLPRGKSLIVCESCRTPWRVAGQQLVKVD